MMLLSSTSGRFDSIVQLFTIVLIFIFVLMLAYFATKFTAGIQKGRLEGANLEVLETLRVAPNKYVQVIRIGKKYFSYVLCKDTVTLLGEVAEDDFSEIKKMGTGEAVSISFKDVLEKFRKR